MAVRVTVSAPQGAVVKCLVAGVIANAVNGRARGSFRCGVGEMVGVREVAMVSIAD